MLEWKPPDPRIVDLVRRVQDAARRFRHAPGSPESFATIDEEHAPDREINDRVREPTVTGADPRDHDPDVQGQPPPLSGGRAWATGGPEVPYGAP
jgi:hypothetical protein